MQRALKFIPGWTPKLTKTDYTLRNSSNPTLAIGSEKTQELTPSTHTHPIENDHPFISLWENCLHQGLVRILGESQWLAIDVLRRGTSDQLKECTVTIIITVADDMLKTGEMDATIIEVKTFLRAECWPGINLELREGGLSTYNSHKEGIVKRPNLGYSIEPEGGLRNGTLGGYVTLKKAGFPPKTCVLTVGHVVQEPPFSQMDHPHGWRQNNWNLRGFPIDSPCTATFTETITALKRQVSECTTIITGIAIATRGHRSLKSPMQRSESAMQTERLHEYRKLHNNYKYMIKKFGRVFATSGNAQHPSGCGLDWALIEVDPARKGNNSLVPQAGHFLPTKVPGTVPLNEAEYLEVENRQEVNPQEVVKFGHASGFTMGTVSHIKSVVRAPRILPSMSNVLPTLSLEECIVGASRSTAFNAPGDSGAWVLRKEDGALVGLLWGVQKGSTWSYMTPIAKVFGNIERRLGCSVEVAMEL